MSERRQENERIAQAILGSAKYRSLHPALVAWVVENEAAKGRSRADTEKAARAKLHQVVSAYVTDRVQGDRWLAALEAAVGDEAALRSACMRILTHHASSRERLPLLEGFYAPLLAGIDASAPLIVLDLACGLNPLALPWMGLPRGSRLVACDVQGDLTDFLARALPLLEPLTGVRSEVLAWNLLDGAPPVHADVALLLKTLPCLEQLDPSLPRRLLESVQAPRIIVSFPLRSLGGRAKGMEVTYSARFEALAADLGRPIERIHDRGELVYRVGPPAA